MEWKEFHLCLLPFPVQQGRSVCCLPGCDKLLGKSQDPGVILYHCQLCAFFSDLMITAPQLVSAIYIRQSFFVLLLCWRKCLELGLLFKCQVGYRFTMICVKSASSLASNLEIPSHIEVECESSAY